MSDLLNRIREKHNAESSRKILIPEWGDGDEPFVAYSSKWTLEDDKALASYIEDNDPEGFAKVVVRKLTDEGGEKLFPRMLHSAQELMKISHATTMKRIANQIISMETAEESEEK